MNLLMILIYVDMAEKLLYQSEDEDNERGEDDEQNWRDGDDDDDDTDESFDDSEDSYDGTTTEDEDDSVETRRLEARRQELVATSSEKRKFGERMTLDEVKRD